MAGLAAGVRGPATNHPLLPGESRPGTKSFNPPPTPLSKNRETGAREAERGPAGAELGQEADGQPRRVQPASAQGSGQAEPVPDAGGTRGNIQYHWEAGAPAG